MSSNGSRIYVVPPGDRFGTWNLMMTEMLRVSDPMARIGAKFSSVADRVYMSNEHCVIYVARRVAEVRNARARRHWIGGRMYNWLTGSSDQYVLLSGTVLANSLKWLGQPVPEGFPRDSDLNLRFDLAEQLDLDLRTKAVAHGMTV